VVAVSSGVPGGIDDGSTVTRNFFMGSGSGVTIWLVSVSEMQMGKVGLVMAVTVLTLLMMGTKGSSVSLSSVSKCITTIGNGTGEYGWAASNVGKYWVTLVLWLVVEHQARSLLVGSSLTSWSVEDGGFVCLDELGLIILALCDPIVMIWTASTCLVRSCERVDQ